MSHRFGADPVDGDEPSPVVAVRDAWSTANQVGGEVHGAVVQAGRIGRVEQHFHEPLVRDQVSRRMFGTMPPRAGAFQNRRVAAELPAAIASTGAVVLSGVGSQVMSGLGGVGKTQLAAEYARTLWHAGKIDVLMWANATSRDAILSAYGQAVAEMRNAPESNAEQAARRWLEWLGATVKRWLVVLDDLQDPADIRGLWPPHTPTGSVVLTTRRRDAALRGDGRRVVEVGLFTPAESESFLADRLATHPAQTEGAAELAGELGHLPVALAQAAAYIADRTTLTCASYRIRWCDRRKTLPQVLPEEGALPDEHRASIATTWSLSIDLADHLGPVGLARPLLQVASLLDSNGIPDTVFTASVVLDHLSRKVGREVDADDARDALSCLHRLSLITHDGGASHRAMRVHALVQRAVRETLSPDQFAAAVRAAAESLIRIWPEHERDADLAAVLRSNTDALRANAELLLWRLGVQQLLFRAGISLAESGQFDAAIDYYRLLSTTAEHELGADHADTLTARHQLAWAQAMTGDAAGALAAFEQLVIDREQALGVNHPHTLAARHNVGRQRGAAGDAPGAVAALEQVLVDCQRVLGDDHTTTLSVRHGLAKWRGEAGDAVGATNAFKQLVTDRERVHGPEALNTLNSRTELARWRGKAGDPAGAVVALEQVLADSERVLGINHPNTLNTRHELARWRGEAGDTAGAAAALEQVVADFERLFGANHPDTEAARKDLTRWRTSEEG